MLQSAVVARAGTTPVRFVGSLVTMTVLGTVGQVAMVVAGHFATAVQQWYPIAGMGISLVCGAWYARNATGKGNAAIGGAIAGGACALLGIVVSVLLGDVPAVTLAIGTTASFVTGLVGGLVLFLAAGRAR